jgi:hypothetical protein
MNELPDESIRRTADADVVQHLREAHARLRSRVSWSVVPEVALHLTADDAIHPCSRPVAFWRAATRAFVRRTGPTLTAVGPYVFLSTSVQHDRVLQPIIDALVPSVGASRRVHLPRLGPWAFIVAVRAAVRFERELDRDHTLARLTGDGAFRWAVHQTAVLQARAERLMRGRHAPDVLVVATQHGATTRAVLAAANRSIRVRTVYVPHAPLADNVFYDDLPAHWALLRGPAEVRAYAAAGVDAGRLSAVGDPSIPAPAGVAPRDGRRVLYALSTDHVGSLTNDYAMMVAAGLTEVEVSMHPRLRDRADLLALIPAGWSLNPSSSTYQRMAEEPFAAVVQHGSGLGLEALALGLPVIELCNPGRTPNYHYTTDPEVPIVATASQLADALVRAVRSPAADEARQVYAAEWTVAFGPTAAASAAEALVAVLAAPRPKRLLLDGWQHAPDATGGTR